MRHTDEVYEVTEQMKSVMMHFSDAIMVMDIHGVVLAVNHGFRNLYGWDSEEVVGFKAPITPEHLREQATALSRNVLRGEEVNSYETIRLHKDGRLLQVNLTLSGVRGTSGDVVALMCVSRDISRRLQLQQSLRDKESEYKTLHGRHASLFEHNPDAVFELNIQGEIIHMNAITEQLMGSTQEELLGKNLDDFLNTEQADPVACGCVVETLKGVSQTFEWNIVRHDQQEVQLEVKTIPVIEHDKVTGMYVVAHDITAQKRGERRLEGYRRILELITSRTSLHDLFQTIVDVVETSSKSLCSIMLLDGDQRLWLAAGKRLANDYVQAINGVKIGENVGSCGTAAYRNELIIVSDIATDDRWRDYREMALQHGLRACWSIPMVSGDGDVLGTFAIYNSIVTTPDSEDIALLESYGKLASIAIEQHQREQRIQHLAYYDALTNLPNRVLFLERLSAAIDDAHQHQGLLSVMFLDIDRFKSINDSLGHRFGDNVLQYVSQRISSCLREHDTLARLGGDEFVILLPQVQNTEEAMRIAWRIVENMKEPIYINGFELRLTISIGLALYPGSGTTPETLMQNADAAMYASKSEGRNKVQVHMPAMNAHAYERLRLENDLRKALEQEEFFFHYQPLLNVQSGQVTSAEALIRWHHSILGMIPPSDFIPLAEEIGLIVPLGTWVLRRVCEQIRQWQDAGLSPVPIAINVSPMQFQQEDFVDVIHHILDDLDLRPEAIQLEVTETALMRNESDAVQKLTELRTMGVKISVDDFGTGYATLSFLKNFPIDRLKVDRSFVQDVTEDVDSAAIISAVVTLGHVRNLGVVAEGVETEEQLQFLGDLKCDELQGYLFSKPVPVGEFETRFLR